MLATYNKTIFENGDFSVRTFIPDDESELPENALKYGTFVSIGNYILYWIFIFYWKICEVGV